MMAYAVLVLMSVLLIYALWKIDELNNRVKWLETKDFKKLGEKTE